MLKIKNFNTINKINHQNISDFPSGESAKIAEEFIDDLRIEIISGVDIEELNDFVCSYILLQDDTNELLESYAIYWDSKTEEQKIHDYYNNFVEGFPKIKENKKTCIDELKKYLEDQGVSKYY